MTLDRALEVTDEDGRESGEGTWEEYLEAIKVGREALQRINHNRLINNHPDQALLPSETRD